MATKIEIRAQLRRLSGVFNPPDAEGEVIIDSWHDILGSTPDAELHDAVTVYLRSDASFFPKPGKLLSIIAQRRRQAQDMAKGSPLFHEDGSCAICGNPMQWVTPDGQPLPASMDPVEHRARLHVIHDLHEHRRVNAPIIGRYVR